ncbi:MAG: hypothetical protein LBJ73_02190 [Rickettsiales bacterium]|jgi:hypothetical protein|nr:hypothetical protein [Rickettsiales bacterium]
MDNTDFGQLDDKTFREIYFGDGRNIPTPDECADMFMPDDPKKACMINGVNVLRNKRLAPLFKGTYYMHHDGWFPEENIVLFKSADDGKKYLMYGEDDFSVLHPYDSTVSYQYFDEEYRQTLLTPEFFYQGKNIFEGMNLQPWYTDKDSREIVSYFKFTGEKLLYKPGYRRLNLLKSEDFKIPRQDPWKIEVAYGYKVKENGVWRLEYNPKKKFFVRNIATGNGTFLDVVSYKDAYEKDWEKSKTLIKTIAKILIDIVTKVCKCKPDDIYLPYKTIVCVFKANADGIKKTLDNPPKYTTTKKGNISKKKPMPTTPSKDVFTNIGTLARMLNDGRKLGVEFYDCDACESESVCMYKQVMLGKKEELKKKEQLEILARYLKDNNGQGHLFPEMLVDVRGRVK